MNTTEQNKLSNEASGWIVRLRSDSVSSSDKAAFSNWLNTDTSHEFAFDCALSDWQITGALKHSRLAQQAIQEQQNQRESFFSRWSFSWQTTAFASIALIATLTVALVKQPPASTTNPIHYTTKVGEQRQIALPDGSEVNLNTDSVIHILYSNHERRLILDKGEAYFKVASNKARPFIVDAGQGTVTAVGTAFGVNRAEDRVKVTVIEGIVSVKEIQTQPQIKPESLLVKANEGLLFDKQGLSTVRPINATNALSWRDKLLVLENQPLNVALNELNRYLMHPVDSSDPSIAGLRVSGTFSLQTPESTLTALITTFELKQDNSGPVPRLYARSE